MLKFQNKSKIKKRNLMKKLTLLAISILLIFGLSGCSKNRAYKTWSNDPAIDDTFNESIVHMANQLTSTSRISDNAKITITSFVDLHKLNKTTHFGRKISESFYSELHKRGFRLVDARGTKTIRINADGEFFITRDIKLLNNKRIENSYILVGTYTKFGNGVMLNARIIDNITGDVLSAGRTVIDVDDCDLYENCEDKAKTKDSVNIQPVVKFEKRFIGISDAGCSKVTCPENCVDGGCYKYHKKPNHVYTGDKIIRKTYKTKHKPVCKSCEIGGK